MTDLVHVANLRVAQSRIAFGDTRWFVQTANGYVIRGPHLERDVAQADLDEIRVNAWAEHEAERLAWEGTYREGVV